MSLTELIIMKESKFEFQYEVYNDITELTEQDAWLLTEARAVTEQAYAPYSNFHVGAVAILENGEVVAGTNRKMPHTLLAFVPKECC